MYTKFRSKPVLTLEIQYELLQSMVLSTTSVLENDIMYVTLMRINELQLDFERETPIREYMIISTGSDYEMKSAIQGKPWTYLTEAHFLPSKNFNEPRLILT